MSKFNVSLLILMFSGLLQSSAQVPAARGLKVEISFSSALSSTPMDGRMFLFISKDIAGGQRGGGAAAGTAGGRGAGTTEPRFQVSDQIGTQQMFAVDVDGLKPGTPAIIDESTLGYSADSLSKLPAGDYYLQGLLNIYTTFHRADGHVVKLPMDQGEGQKFERKPGNFYSTPVKMHFDPAASTPILITLDRKIPPIAPPTDTEWVKHIRIQSPLLSKFWGQPMYIGANVILPLGWNTHPNAHYPLMVQEGHFSADLAPRLANHAPGSFYDDWTSGKLPKMLLMDIQHANPYYDDSYAVNSANVGPYGDAIVQELIPAVEKQFRGIGQGWARVTYGGSTGGWESIAQQIYYPDEYNGTWTFCPDPIDFHAYQIVDIYNDDNANWLIGPWSKVDRPSVRRPDGTVITTMERENHRELVRGTRGRSADQYNIWQAVYSPVAADGYPAEIWDEMTGKIDQSVAQYWKDHYDLTAWVDSHWNTLAPKLNGKIHVWVGDEDTYYLDNAVYLFQAMVEKHSDPKIAAEFDYGRKPAALL